MTKNSEDEHNLEIAVTLTAIFIFAWTIFGIMFTAIYIRDVLLANADYLSSEAVVVQIGGPQVRSPSNLSDRSYTFFCYCRFEDHNGVSRSGFIRTGSREPKSEFWINDVLTVYYKLDHKDGDQVWCSPPPYPEAVYYFWPWAFLLITLIIHINKRTQYKKRYG